MVLTYDSFDEAALHATDDDVVAGAYHLESGEGVYFVVRRDIPEIEMRMKAFEVRYGKPMTEYGKRVLSEAMGS